MGVKGFQLLYKSYKDQLCGPHVPIQGKLLVDGYSVLHDLYTTNKLEWATGGCYADQVKATQEYYGALVRGGVEPIVVLDGGGQKTNIYDTIHRRNRDISKICGDIRKQHESIDKECKEYDSHHLPILSRHVYLSTLKKMDDVKVYVADGKALEMVVQLANCHRCPVLTNSSNFCISGVKGGVIFTKDLNLQETTAPIYEQSKLVTLLNLPNPDLLLAIVAITGDGSDTVPFLYHGGIRVDIERVCKEQGIEKDCKEKGIEFKDRHRFFNTADYLKAYQCQSFKDFKSNIDDFKFRPGQKRKLTANCRNVIETYNIPEMKVNEDGIVERTTLQCHASHNSFRQVVRQHRAGNYPVLVMDAVCAGKCMLDADVGDAGQPPVPLVGQHIRREMYEFATPFMSRSGKNISEYCRSKTPTTSEKPWEYAPTVVEPYGNWNYKELSVDTIFDMDSAKREAVARDAVLKVLKFPESSREKFCKPSDENYLLGIYTTRYWAYHLYRSHSANHLEQLIDQLIEALVLNFLLCPQREDYSHDQNYFNPMWIKVYHALLEWQCLYKDVCSLNQMLLSPFNELPLTNILNGSFVIELALSEADSLISHLDRLDADKRDLYDRMIQIFHQIKPESSTVE